jgi:hypothetical protein
VVAPGGAGPIASVRAISYDEMIQRGNEAMDIARYRAASLYYGAALTVRPFSTKARDLLARARYQARRKKSTRDDLTRIELSLPPPPREVLEDVDRLIQRWEEAAGKGEAFDESPIVGEEESRPAEELTEEDVAELKERRPPELTPRIPEEEKGERPTIKRPSITTWIGSPSRMPCKPLRTGRNSLFHTLIHLPAFEGARTLPALMWQIESGYDGSLGHLNDGAFGWDWYIRYDNNRYDEGYLKISHGLTESIEARVELLVGNLREGGSDLYLNDKFTPYIQPYDRRTDLGNLILSLKSRIYRPLTSEPETGLSAELAFKLPVARNPKNFTTSGMPDLCAQVMGTVDLFRFLSWPRLVPSFAFGATIPFGEIYFDRDVDLDPVFFFGAGTIIQLDDSLAVVAQIEGNTSAFGEFDQLSGMVLTSHTGLRFLLGHFIIETSIGHGFTPTSSKFVFTLNIGFRFEGKELVQEILR